VFVESYLEINKIVENKKYQKYFKEESHLQIPTKAAN
jgi:hypothetical protein